ncbi:MAG: hypothetical protein AB7G39_09325 [Alphaproteobacteria bacterium]
MTTQKQLKDFETKLAQIVGSDLARDLVMFGRAPTPLEAELLKSDGVTELTPDQREAVLNLIAKYRG